MRRQWRSKWRTVLGIRQPSEFSQCEAGVLLVGMDLFLMFLLVCDCGVIVEPFCLITALL